VAFPRVYSKFLELLQVEQILIVEGVWKIQGDRTSLRIDSVCNFEDGLAKATKGLAINIDLSETDESGVESLYNTMSEFTGDMSVILRMYRDDDYMLELPLSDKYAIKPNESFFQRMNALYGKKSYEVLTDKSIYDNQPQESRFKHEALYMADGE
jgi:hypothetical protein